MKKLVLVAFMILCLAGFAQARTFSLVIFLHTLCDQVRTECFPPCPPCPCQEQLVFDACSNERIGVTGYGYTTIQPSEISLETLSPVLFVETRFFVWKMPAKTGGAPELLLKTPWTPTYVSPDGIFSSELPDGFQLTEPGIYQFSFKVKKQNGEIGKKVSRVIVFECN